MLQKVYAAVPKTVAAPDLGINNLAEVFNILINVVLGAGIALTIVFLILGGIQYMASKGDQKAAQQARDWLTNAVVGFIVVVGAFTIKTIIQNMIGFTSPTQINDVVNL